MITRHAGIDFLSFADARGVEPQRTDALTTVLTVMDWFEERPAMDTAPGDDTDVLTLRWGPQARPGPEQGHDVFALGISRTMVVGGTGGLEAWRLDVSYQYPTSELTDALWSGTRACGSGLALPGLRNYLRKSLQGAFARVATPQHVVVDFARTSAVGYVDLVPAQALAS